MKSRMGAGMWAELVAGWESSGRSAAEFASEHGIAEATLRWWKTELGRRARKEERRRPPRPGPSAGGVPLAKVVRQHTDSSVTTSRVAVLVGAARIVVEVGFDGHLLREVVRALGEPR